MNKLVIKLLLLIFIFSIISLGLAHFFKNRTNYFQEGDGQLKPSISLDAMIQKKVGDRNFIVGFKSEIEELDIVSQADESALDMVFDVAQFELGKNKIVYRNRYELIDPQIIIFLIKDINKEPNASIYFPTKDSNGKTLTGFHSNYIKDNSEHHLLIYIDPSIFPDSKTATSYINNLITKAIFISSDTNSSNNLPTALRNLEDRYKQYFYDNQNPVILNVLRRGNFLNFLENLNIFAPKKVFAQSCQGTFECGGYLYSSDCPIGAGVCENGFCTVDGTPCYVGDPICSCQESWNACANLTCNATNNCTNDCSGSVWGHSGCTAGMYNNCYISGGPAPTLPPGVLPTPTPISPPGGCDALCTTTNDCAIGTCSAGRCRCGGTGLFSCLEHRVRNDRTGMYLGGGAQPHEINHICIPLTTTFTHSLRGTGTWDLARFALEDSYSLELPKLSNIDERSYTEDIKNRFNYLGQTKNFFSDVFNNAIPNEPAYCSPQIVVTNSCPRTAICNGFSFPTIMNAGQPYNVQLTMKNGGAADTWSNANFRLGSASPLNNTTWGRTRVDFPNGVEVPFNTNYTFNFQVTAPSTPGNYASKWQMLEIGPTWFGEVCGPDIVTVAPGCPSNLQLTCNGTQLQTSWTSAPAGVTHYHHRANHDYGNNNQCVGPNPPALVDWYCPAQGDQAHWNHLDSNPASGSETNSLNINITPAVPYRITVNSVQSGVQGCGIAQTVVCPTLTPTPTPTPAIRGNIYLDQGANIVGNSCTQSGSSYANPLGPITINSGGNTGTITNNQTYSVNTITYGNHPVTLNLTNQTPSANTYVCACPVNASDPFICHYSGITSPSENINFYLRSYNLSNTDSWWQSSGGNVFGRTGIRSHIPSSTCEVSGDCYPALMAKNPFTASLSNTTGFPMINSGSIITNTSGNTYIHEPGANSSNNGSSRGTTLEELRYADLLARMPSTPTVVSNRNFNELSISADQTNILSYQNSLTLNESHNWNIPAGTSIIVFVDGDLTLEDTTPTTPDQIVTVQSGGFLIFIIRGNLIVSPSVGYSVANDTTLDPASTLPNIEGVFVADGIFRTESQAPATSDKKIVFAGTYVGWGGVELNRSFAVTDDLLSIGRNNTNAIETFIHRPDFVMNAPIELRSSQMMWQEVAPSY